MRPGRFCFVSPHLTCFPSSERMRKGFAVSGSRVTSTERNIQKANVLVIDFSLRLRQIYMYCLCFNQIYLLIYLKDTLKKQFTF
uniref:Uncharacterized protein n=1 Tax=Astyanax mexicanus TaxID=7994 RepID=A0A8B9JCP7_ASTMX